MPKWYNSQVVDIVNLTPHTKSFWLRIEDPDMFDYKPGQFITLDLPIHEKRHKRWRSYSIANLPRENGVIELCIVSLEHGQATHYLFHELKIGDTIKFKGPDGGFILTDDMLDKELVMICTGTGVAPFRSMLLDLKSRNAFKKKVHLIFGTRRQEDILYQEDFSRLAIQEPHFTYTVTLSREVNWPGDKGYVHPIYLSQYHKITEDRLFLICGWSKMIDETVENLILKLGYDKSQVRYELYG
ncbi:MAG: hypothetical protein KDC53_14795 [Saprospiraceae bacterium]|nr:hypothetical protein [Saprospiraceae bacterium]